MPQLVFSLTTAPQRDACVLGHADASRSVGSRLWLQVAVTSCDRGQGDVRLPLTCTDRI